MESHYSLNIAIVLAARAWDWTPHTPRYQATHFARVNLGRDRSDAVRKAADFAARFPEGDKPGEFKMSLTYWNCVEEYVQFERPAAVASVAEHFESQVTA